MPVLVIGGHTRSVGKTSVVAGLIAALPDLHWTALKITQYGHGVCSANGEACDCATADHSLAVSEETDRSGGSDTSRFLVAGADHSWWVRTRQGRLAEAMPRIRTILAKNEHVIIESNSILRFLKPDLYLTVLDPATADFKTSAQEFLDRADAILLHADEIDPGLPALGSRENVPHNDSLDRGNSLRANPVWRRVSLKPVANRPTFAIDARNYVPREVVEFVRARIAGSREAS
jgi:hypothetical protein